METFTSTDRRTFDGPECGRGCRFIDASISSYRNLCLIGAIQRVGAAVDQSPLILATLLDVCGASAVERRRHFVTTPIKQPEDVRAPGGSGCIAHCIGSDGINGGPGGSGRRVRSLRLLNLRQGKEGQAGHFRNARDFVNFAQGWGADVPSGLCSAGCTWAVGASRLGAAPQLGTPA